MKRIAFVTAHLNICGINRALVNLINALPADDLDITVMTVDYNGEMSELIGDSVKILNLSIPKSLAEELVIDSREEKMVHYLKEMKFSKFFGSLFKRKNNSTGVDFDDLSRAEEDFDTAVCFDGQNNFLLKYVDRKIDAAHKVVWFHRDLNDCEFDAEDMEKSLEGYESIFAVSEHLNNQLDHMFPSLIDKIYTAYDVVPVDSILNEASEDSAPEFHRGRTVKLLTIGGMSKKNGLEKAINVCAKVKAKGKRIKWIMLGSGEAEYSIGEQIKLLGLEEDFLILGNKLNPYPYIRKCDMLISPFKSEGMGLALSEAKVFAKPIICTEFDGVEEQLENGVNGSVVKFDENSLENEILRIIDAPEIGKGYSESLTRDSKIKQTDIEFIKDKLFI